LLYQEKSEKERRALLVGVQLTEKPGGESKEFLEELALLAQTAGLQVDHQIVQERDKIHPATFVGSGKVDDILSYITDKESTVVIFDDDLSPAQIRNLEKILNVKVIDRSTLILDIFARHARSREAKTQVELAQLQYLLPRLTRQWTHLSRQVGGIGTRGPGETQLETDRRLVRKRIKKLSADLQKIDRQQSIRRKNRKNLFRVALIGYTNVGKSTIMNLFSDASVRVENQLFATLDSTVRRVKVNENHEILLGDTVGFIRKLPAHLVASFQSTLDEVREADLLLHIVDGQNPQFREQMKVVMSVLQELNVRHMPMVTVFNKIDLITDTQDIGVLKKEYPNSILFSALRHIGVEALKRRITQFIEKKYVTMKIEVPITDQKLIHFLHATGHIIDRHYDGNFVELTLKCSQEIYAKLNKKDNNIEILSNHDMLKEEADS
jgi:GTP-binding protein HflX